MKISGRPCPEVVGFPLEWLYPVQTSQVFEEHWLHVQLTSARNAGKSAAAVVGEAGVASGLTLESSIFCPRCA